MSLLLLFRPSSTAAEIVVVGRFDAPTPGGDMNEGAPGAPMLAGVMGGDINSGSPEAGLFDSPTPGRTVA